MAIFITYDPIRPSRNHRRFIVNFHGTPITTTVTSASSVVRKWLRTTLHHRCRHLRRLVVGLGVQWRPSSYPGEDPPAATLQLCVGRRCLIFQLVHSATVPNLLRRFLANPNNTFVGMWNHSDSEKLLYSEHQLGMADDPLDLRKYARSKYTGRSLERESRETIVKEYLGLDVDFDRWVGRSEWDDEELDDDQIVYAAVDAYASFAIGKDLRAWEL